MASERKQPKKLSPARTPEEQQNRMISLAVTLAERQLLDGTASPTTVNHFLKLATTKEEHELKKLKLENELLKARTEQIGSQANSESMYKEAIAAFKVYSGNGGPGEEDED